MGFIIGFLTLIMVLVCIALIGLVLIQLPKKDTGGGLAFGGGASDALFGAGSGTVLTKITKYFATAFFALAILLALLQSNFRGSSAAKFGQALQAPPRAPMTAPAQSQPPAQGSAVTPAPTLTGSNAMSVPSAASTNVPAEAVPTGTNSTR